MGLDGDSVTGGMGGDYTSCDGAIKTNGRNSTTPQAEVEHCRGWLRQYTKFAGGFSVAGLTCVSPRLHSLARLQ
jgi:hypothetical protein